MLFLTYHGAGLIQQQSSHLSSFHFKQLPKHFFHHYPTLRTSTSTLLGTGACSLAYACSAALHGHPPLRVKCESGWRLGPPSAPHNVVDPPSFLPAPSVADPVTRVQRGRHCLPASGGVCHESEDRCAGMVDLPYIQRTCPAAATIERTVV